MKVIQTPARFYPCIGGTEQVAFYLSRELVKKGHVVKVICADEPAAGGGIIDGIEVKRIPYIGKVANTNITLSLGSALLKEDFDIIHTHLPHPWSADISAFISLIKNKPLFLTYHNDITGRGVNKITAGLYNLALLRFLLNRACKIFITHKNYLTSSPFLKAFTKKVVVTPPGVDLEKFRPLDIEKSEENIIFFLSKLDKFHRYKGLDYLILSIKKLVPKTGLRLYVGGDGELAGYYKKVVEENGLENIVTFLGELHNQQVVRYYNLCDIFVLPSVSSTQEGFGLVALEAMACKRPVVITSIVGVSGDVEKENAGIVIEPKNTEVLSRVLEQLLSDKNKCRKMGNNAYNLVRSKYTWLKHAEIVEKEYLGVV